MGLGDAPLLITADVPEFLSPILGTPNATVVEREALDRKVGIDAQMRWPLCPSTRSTRA